MKALLKKIREYLNMSQTELAELLNISFATVNRWETGKTQPTYKALRTIKEYCEKTGQHVPQDYKEMARCIFESLALRYREVLGYLKEMAPFEIEKLHVIGGGTYNEFLMQLTANAIGIPVVTGPVEGTAIGNIMLQAKAAGLVCDIYEMRSIIANSIDLKTYLPQG